MRKKTLPFNTFRKHSSSGVGHAWASRRRLCLHLVVPLTAHVFLDTVRSVRGEGRVRAAGAEVDCDYEHAALHQVGNWPCDIQNGAAYSLSIGGKS